MAVAEVENITAAAVFPSPIALAFTVFPVTSLCQELISNINPPGQTASLSFTALIVGQLAAGHAAGSTENVAVHPFVVVTVTLNAAGSVPGVAVGIVAGEKVSPAHAIL